MGKVRSCGKVEVDILDSPSLTVPMVSMDDIKREDKIKLRRCVKEEVDVLGSPSLIDLVVPVDVKRHQNE